MESRNKKVKPPKQTALIIHIIKTLCTTSVARTLSFWPKKIELIVAPPIPTNVQKATTKFINGKVIAKPAIANAPTP